MFEIVNNIVSEMKIKNEPDFAERTTTHTHGVIEHTTPMAETQLICL
jgi:hypothetical protein